MLTTVQRWSGREARALREAMRASVRDFAAHLGVSARMVSKWESGGESVCPRPETQAILDTCLERAGREATVRFVASLDGTGANLLVEELGSADADSDSGSPGRHLLGPVDGKRMSKIGTGLFLYGDDRKQVWLPAFYIDVTPVTNADYAAFVAVTRHQLPGHWVDGTPPPGLLEHPVVGVTHGDASAYANWAGKLLPSSEQWEKAARGTKGIEFPWGNHRTAAKCNVRETDIGHTTQVRRYHSGISPYGVYDMSGNVWEWCSTEVTPGRFMLRGSAFTSSLGMARTTAVNDADAEMYDDDTGFRCVASPSTVELAVSAL